MVNLYRPTKSKNIYYPCPCNKKIKIYEFTIVFLQIKILPFLILNFELNVDPFSSYYYLSPPSFRYACYFSIFSFKIYFLFVISHLHRRLFFHQNNMFFIIKYCVIILFSLYDRVPIFKRSVVYFR